MSPNPTATTEPSRLFVRESGVPTIKVTDALWRQKRVIVLATILGTCLGWLYYTNASTTYVSTARIMVSQRDSTLMRDAANRGQESLVNEDILANHMELLRSRRNVERALTIAGLLQSPSLLNECDDDQDVTDYVIDNLKLSRGGKGATAAARSMLLEFRHTQPDDAAAVLNAVIAEYMTLIERQFEDSLSTANRLVLTAQDVIQQELEEAQKTYVEARRDAPVLFTGEGSSNVHVEQFKSLSGQLIDLEIKETTTGARLAKANAVADEYRDTDKVMPIEALGVIDTDSLERLGVFANLRADSTRSAEFQMNQPERLEEARAQYNRLLNLMLEKQRLEADFGAGHPDVQKLQQEIDLVRQFLEENKVEPDAEMDEPQLTSRQLLGAYIGFLKNELQSLAEQKKEIQTRIMHAEQRARGLVQFELEDQLLKSRIDRHQQLFDGFVEQLRTLDMAGSIDGISHEVLESPRPGLKVWPRLSIVMLASALIGLGFGTFGALVNDQLDGRFQSAGEIDTATSIPVIGYVDRLPVSRNRCLVNPAAAESEVFRMLRTMLLSEVRDGKLTSLTATSPSPSDGKSTILANIAASFAALDMPVVLVEGDMRRPTFRKRMNLKSEPGLSEVLRGEATIEQALCSTSNPNLHVIHAGGPVENPAELLQSETFDVFLKELRSQFALAVVDVGPVLAISDPLVVAQKVDGTVLIVRPSADSRQQITGAADILHTAGARLLGTVVNTYGCGKDFHTGRYSYGPSRSASIAYEMV